MEEFKVQALMHAVRFVFNYFSNFEPLYITYWHNECLPGLWKWACFSRTVDSMIINTTPVHYWTKWKCTLETDQVWIHNCILPNWTARFLMLSFGSYTSFVWATDQSIVILHKAKPGETTFETAKLQDQRCLWKKYLIHLKRQTEAF